MADRETAQQYVVFALHRLLPDRPIERPLTTADIDDAVWNALDDTNTGLERSDYELESLPFVTFHPGDAGEGTPGFTPQVMFSASFPSEAAAERFRTAVYTSIERGESPFESIGINPAISLGEYSIPEAPDATLFGTLDDARHLVRADQLPPALDGHSVNVVIIDSGIDKSIVPAGQYGGGWHAHQADPLLPPPPPPGQATGSAALHGMMVVNTILALAPRARIFDVPLIPPPKVYHARHFLIAAHATYHHVLHSIRSFRQHGQFPGPWIFMNAWAIFDRRSEGSHLGEYTENLGPFGIPPHHFIHMIERVAHARCDLVFSAGNCGEVCPDGRCGPNDFGPGRGIWGANAHQDVLTVGAVRVDATWAGYSSEGPGPTPNLDERKPDLCGPSQFMARAGRYPPSTGTSGAAAIVAGAVAALRSRANWDETTVPPYMMKLILNDTAVQTQGLGWNRWLGNGILDARAAYQRLLMSYP